MLGSPMPAPKPRERTLSGAVEYPSCIARWISLIPGPLSAKITVIFSTHHIEEASSLCDEIYIIDKGIVKSHGTVDEIIKVSGAKNLEDAYLKFIEGTGEDKEWKNYQIKDLL